MVLVVLCACLESQALSTTPLYVYTSMLRGHIPTHPDIYIATPPYAIKTQHNIPNTMSEYLYIWGKNDLQQTTY